MGLSDELRGLSELHQQGGLSDDEFAAAKSALLEQASEPPVDQGPEPELSTTVEDFPNASWTPLESLPKYRRFEAGSSALVACQAGHVQATSSDYLNLWLERRSLAGKLQRFGNRAQHVGNVMTPGIGTMLAGRSGRRLNDQTQQDLLVNSLLQCQQCGFPAGYVAT